MANFATLMWSCRTVLVLAFLSVATVAMADPADDMQPYIDDWLDQYVHSQTQSLTEIPNADVAQIALVRDLFKKSLKSRVKSGLVDHVFGQQFSVSMAQILQSVEDATSAHAQIANKPFCQRAALATASEGLNASREIRGAGKTIVDVFMSLVELRKGIRTFVPSKLKTAALALLDELSSGSDLEVFTEQWTVGNCFVGVNVIWKKTSGEFEFLVLGDCSCRDTPVPASGKAIELAQWSVRGRGIARWVGAEEEERRAGRVEASSTILGEPRLDRVTSNAACCKNGTAVPSDIHPYSDPGRSARAAPCDPEETNGGTRDALPADDAQQPRPTTQTGLDWNRGGFSDLDGAIPHIPDGPMPEEQKMQLLAQSVGALRRIEDRKLLAEQDLEALEARRNSGNPPTAEDLESGQEAILELEALERRARETLNKIESLIAPSSDEDGGGSEIIFASPDSQVAFSDRRAAIEDFRPVAACRP